MASGSLTEMNRICLISTSGIGNTILFTPVITNLAQAFPQSTIAFVGTKQTLEVARAFPQVHELIPYELKNRWALFSAIRRFHPDITLCAFPDRGPFLSIATIFSGAKIRQTYGPKTIFGAFAVAAKNPALEFDKHEMEYNLELIRDLDVPVLHHQPEFRFLPKDRVPVESFLVEQNLKDAPFVGCHPGSSPSQTFKRWPLDRFAHVGREAVKKGYRFLIFGGPEEKEMGDDLKNQIGEGALNVAGRFPLRSSGWLISQCRAFLSNDSGMFHIANALQIPNIVLFGPTSELKNGPTNPASVVMRAEVDCRPCYDGRPPSDCALECLTGIYPQDVAERLLDLAEKVG